MKKPTAEQLVTAILWLEKYKGDEADACRAVAEWLFHLTHEDRIRRAARTAGIPVATVRRKLER